MNDFLSRLVVDGLNRDEWLGARVGKIGASNAASFAKLESAPLYAKAMIDTGWQGNAYTAHGNDRERAILTKFGVEQNRALFRSEQSARYVATPDGFKVSATGQIILVQVKTSNKPITKIPPAYCRQIAWEQMVMGAERTLFVWEEHTNFRPDRMDPDSLIVERDDAMIEKLISIADAVLEILDDAASFKKEMEAHRG